ncbi:MAG: AAA family ATPase, partial [Anaerotignum sp.]|nr:AAA family ATPase [Anaerotignum sp.]
MKIQLQNIGIVKDSTIDLNGLTVITGKNNSGKTTVGKVVYSLLDAVCNLQVKARSDRYIYIRKQLYKVTDCLDIFRTLKTITSNENNESFFSKYTALNTLFSKDFRWEIDRRNIETFAKDLMYELESFDISELKTNLECIAYYKYLMAKDKPINYIAIFEEQRFKALEILDKMFIAINQDFELISYTR